MSEMRRTSYRDLRAMDQALAEHAAAQERARRRPDAGAPRRRRR